MLGNKSVSLCMVVYNTSIKDTYESVKSFIDELVVIDQNSSEEYAKEYKELSTVYIPTTNKGNADFDRQWCYSLAQKDFILAMDSDEIISPEDIEKLKEIADVDFECCWFNFKNLVSSNGITIDLKEFLGDDPHPRLWKKILIRDNQQIPTLVWGSEAHTFPQINTGKIVFSNSQFTHHRQLENIIRTHLRRGKNISPSAQGVEKQFVNKLLEKFGSDVRKVMLMKFPELSDYLRN